MAGFVQNLVRATTAGAVTSLTSGVMGANMTPGNNIIVAVKSSNALAITSVTDTQGNLYVQDASAPVVLSGRVGAVYSCLNPTHPLTTADTVTANFGGSASGAALVVAEYNGLFAADVNGRNDSGGTPVTSGTVASGGLTNNPNELVVVGVAFSALVTAVTPSGTLVLRNGGTSINGGLVALLDDFQPGRGTPSEAFSWTASAAFAAALATYLTAPPIADPTLGMSGSPVRGLVG